MVPDTIGLRLERAFHPAAHAQCSVCLAGLVWPGEVVVHRSCGA